MITENSSTQTYPFVFTGKGNEYFRIWIVNLALTILTLGIYSAWAKVRRLQYFYRNTALAGSNFDYHGDPKAILKGRLIGVGLLAIYNVTAGLNVWIALIAFALSMAIFPWLLQRSLCFKLHNSSYRGLRFRFAGDTGGAYRAFLLWPLLACPTLGLLGPLVHQRMKAYQHNNSRYGVSPFGFHAPVGGFYRIYGKALLMLGVPIVVGFALNGLGVFPTLGSTGLSNDQQIKVLGGLMIAFLGFYLLAFLFIGPWFAARVQNLVWNNTSLTPHRFASHVSARGLLAIYLTNFIGILLTLGLFKPYADIRLAKYRLEQIALLAEGDFDAFIADQTQSVSATGEEMAEVFDFDIAF